MPKFNRRYRRELEAERNEEHKLWGGGVQDRYDPVHATKCRFGKWFWTHYHIIFPSTLLIGTLAAGVGLAALAGMANGAN